MGQKSNLLTLRKSKRLNLQTSNPKEFIYGLNLLTFFNYLFYKKNVIVVDSTLNFEANKLFLNFVLFFQTTKLLNFQSIKKTESFIGPRLNPSCLFPLIKRQFSILNNNCIQISVKTINHSIQKSSLVFFFNKLKRFSTLLFARRLNLFIDFVKLSCLLDQNKINAKVFLFIIGQIFRTLSKSKHNIFLVFLKTVFQIFVDKKNIAGIKLLISGRIKGKPRSNTTSIVVGSLPVQSLSKNIEYSKLHVYTLNGAFGFKFWVYRKSF